jgi:hypothetical protein
MSISMNNPNRNADVIKDPASTGTRDSIFNCSRAKGRMIDNGENLWLEALCKV